MGKDLEVVFFGGIFSYKPKKVPISRCFWLSEEFPTEVMKFKCKKSEADMNKMRAKVAYRRARGEIWRI